MLRIECTCGKFLKVNDALLGKKIKCPACAAIQVVKKPASAAVTAKPRSAPELDEDDAPPPHNKKAPAGNGVQKGKPMPKKGMTREDDEDEAPKRKKPAAKKNNSMVLVAVIGGAVVLLLAIGGGVWFFFLRGDSKPVAVNPSGKTKTGGDKQGGNSEPVAIKFFVPYKKGDKREVKVVGARKDHGKFTDESNLTAEQKMVAEMMKDGNHQKATLVGEITTLDTNDKGEETKVKVVLKQVKIEVIKGKEKPDETPPSGTVVVGTRVADKFFSWSEPRFGHFCEELLSNRYADFPESEVDDVFGTKENQTVGDTWTLSMEKYLKSMKESSKGGPASGSFTEPSGTGKLANITSENGKNYLDVELDFKFETKDKDASMSIKGMLTVRLPQDGRTGPVKKTSKEEMSGDYAFPDPSGAKQMMKVTGSKSATTDIKYLGNFPIKDEAAVKKKDDPLPPKTTESPSFDIGLSKVEWVDGQAAVNVSANYDLTGKPNPGADYTLYVRFATDGGGMKDYIVQTVAGDVLKSDGRLQNPNLAILLPPKDKTGVCDLVVKEKGMGTPEKEVGIKEKVSVGGNPPMPKTPEKPAADTVQFELSKPKLERVAANNTYLEFEYKVSSGKVDPKKFYRLVGSFKGSTVKENVKLYEIRGDQLTVKDKVKANAAVDIAVDAQFEIFLVEGTADIKKTLGTKISNMLPGQVGGVATAPVANVHFQFGKVVATKAPAPKKGVAPAQVTLTFTWSLKSGQPNPKASYAVYLIFQGAQNAIVPPQQFQLGQFSLPLPYVPNTPYEIQIVEQVPGQQPRVVDSHKGIIR